jgi:hypothetical protein
MRADSETLLDRLPPLRFDVSHRANHEHLTVIILDKSQEKADAPCRHADNESAKALIQS